MKWYNPCKAHIAKATINGHNVYVVRKWTPLGWQYLDTHYYTPTRPSQDFGKLWWVWEDGKRKYAYTHEYSRALEALTVYKTRNDKPKFKKV